MPRDWYVNESELDDFQVQIINRRSDRSFIVRGCAGSGKTILALWKAKEIAEKEKGSYYVIVFTRALRQFINDGIKAIGLDSDRITYHWIWEKNLGAPSADYIIVDEAQDFTRSQIEALKNKAKKAVIFYGDSAQQLYMNLHSEPTMTLEQISTLTNLPMEQLVYNHRLPKKIARFAQFISSVDDELERRCVNEGDNLPDVLKLSSITEQYNFIIKTITNRNLTDVGILFPHNNDVEKAYKYFQEKGINCEARYSKGPSINIMNLNFATDNPKLLTYHSAKGLQFESVFLPNCYEEGESFRNPTYVAITRSYSDVFILHSGNLSSFFNDVPKEYYNTNMTSEKSQFDNFGF